MHDHELVELLRAWSLGREPRVSPMPIQGHSSQAWLVEASGERFVAKLIFDGRRYAEPGLHVASAVERAGIPAGAPVPTAAGELCVGTRSAGRSCTLALLRFVAGERLEPARADAPELAGGLLGRVHSVLLRDSERDWVPAELLDWCETQARTVPEPARSRAVEALTAIREIGASGTLRHAVVYGDPSPEIVVTARPGEVALIDWGTPSWAPLAHDLAVWSRFAARGAADAEERLLAAYEEQLPLGDAERDAIPFFHRLHSALGLGV